MPPDRRKRGSWLAFFSAGCIGEAIVVFALGVQGLAAGAGSPTGMTLPNLAIAEAGILALACFFGGWTHFSSASVYGDPRYRLRGQQLSPWKHSALICVLFALLLGVYWAGGAIRHTAQGWLVAIAFGLLYAGFVCMGLAIECVFAPPPGQETALGEPFDTLPASAPTTTAAAPIYKGEIVNTFLERFGEAGHFLLFRSSKHEKRQCVALIVIAALAFGTVDAMCIALHFMMHHPPPQFYLIAGFFPVITVLCGYTFAIVTRQAYVNQTEFDTDHRSYRQTSVNRAGWAEGGDSANALRWSALQVHDGSIDADLRGVGVHSFYVSRQGMRYQAVAAWRDPSQPEAKLSQSFQGPTDAHAAMQDAAALLGVPALGELNI